MELILVHPKLIVKLSFGTRGNSEGASEDFKAKSSANATTTARSSKKSGRKSNSECSRDHVRILRSLCGFSAGGKGPGRPLAAVGRFPIFQSFRKLRCRCRPVP